MIDRFYPTNGICKERSFNGGTIRGIIKKLDYIQNLGMNSIMLTPFYLTNEYHGYHVKDYTKVDPHFGDWSDVRTLTEEIHRRNMIVVADFVPNHCHESNSLFSDGKHADWFLCNNDGTIKGFAGITSLPMFNTNHPEVQEYFIKQTIKLCQYGFDAIRLDHASGPSYTFWNFLCKQVKKQYPNVQLIGEIFGELDFKPQSKLRYFWNKLLHSAQEARQLEYINVLDGLLDFRYLEIVRHCIKNKEKLLDNKVLDKQIEKHFKHYPANFKLWLFLDNHDLNRFMYECQGDYKLLQEAITYTKKWDKAFLMYYGTEAGMMNKEDIHNLDYGDEQVRECMKW